MLCGTPVDRRTVWLQVSVGGADKLRGTIARMCLSCSLLVVANVDRPRRPLPAECRRGVVVEVAVERLRQSLGRPEEEGLAASWTMLFNTRFPALPWWNATAYVEPTNVLWQTRLSIEFRLIPAGFPSP